MPVIQTLPRHLADLIAAGEVVERPASVAKELIENAIDAGATRITVEIENGGISYLRIADNGCGMEEKDAHVAFFRHATSKIKTESDLNAISTLGFRGEALAAIAAVSRIDLFTRQEGAVAGIHLHLQAGEIDRDEPAGCPTGTTIVVRDLFFNTPARMKFLRKDFTEAGYVLAAVQHAALSHPEIAFSLLRDGKQVFSTDGRGKLLSPVLAVFGKELTRDMIEISPIEEEGYGVRGYLTRPYAGRANRSMQHFFVNTRYVKSRLLQTALEEAYRGTMMTGKYPSGAIFLTLPLSLVDVNVHPAKTEVKFSQEKAVFHAVYRACKAALEAEDNVPQLQPRGEKPREDHVTKEQMMFAVVPARASMPMKGSEKASVQEENQTVPTLEEFLFDSERVARQTSSSRMVHAMHTASPLEENLISSQAWQRAIAEAPSEQEIKTMQQAAQEITAVPPEQQVQPADMEGGVEPLTDILVHAMHAASPLEGNSIGSQAWQKAIAEAPSEQEIKTMQGTSDAAQEMTASGVLPEQEVQQADTMEGAEPLTGGVRVIGECFATYLLAEDKDGLILIDKHAAHERMLYNQLQENVSVCTQQLLTPIVVELTAAEYVALQEGMNQLEAEGFLLEPFGEHCFAVRAIPGYLDAAEVPQLMGELAEKLQRHRAATPDKLEELIHSMACKAAVKGGRPSSMHELELICRRVLHEENLRACPHGRPIMVRMTKYELDKWFKRVKQ